ncbi:MAG: FMN-binding protein [Oscillospiraceae bacterium]|nr:FMN-binding protein [Oscillospiraceae bacterium]
MKLSKRAKYILLAASLALVIAIGFGLNYLLTLTAYKRDVEAIQAQNVDLSTIADGVYYGDCNVDFVSAVVRVVVKDHQITELELVEHNNDRGAAAEVIPDRIVEQQRIDVDTVAGATSSSRVIQEAVYNALTGDRTIRK